MVKVNDGTTQRKIWQSYFIEGKGRGCNSLNSHSRHTHSFTHDHRDECGNDASPHKSAVGGLPFC